MVEKINYFDCHVDTLTEISGEKESLQHNRCNLDLERVFAFAEKYVQVFALWKDRNTMENNPETEFLQLYQRARSLLDAQSESMTFCQSGADMKKAHAAGKAAAFLSIEDISIMGNMAKEIKKLGFTFAMLTWNYENAYGAGAVYSQKKGLSAKGKQLVFDLLNQDIVLDVSHLSDAGVDDILSITQKTVIASHSNAREVCAHPRNLPKEHIREIIKRKGIIGINFYAPFVGNVEKEQLKELFRHIDYIFELGGEDAVVLGSDFDGCGNRLVKGIDGVESVPYLLKEMRKAGFGEKLCDNIIFWNGYRFLGNI